MMTRAEVEAAIAERAANDPAFRELLVTDPRAGVEAVIGSELPDAVRVTVHEESLTDVHLVIPAATVESLSEDDLELVAGGWCWVNAGDIKPAPF